MEINRRTFIKGLAAGLAAAPFSAEALRQLFSIDYTGDEKELQKKNTALFRGELGQYEGIRIISRHAVSLGPLRDVDDNRIARARGHLVNWIRKKRITTNKSNIRFCYNVDDFGNEVGIGVAIYSHPVREGLTWGQMERMLRMEVRSIA